MNLLFLPNFRLFVIDNLPVKMNDMVVSLIEIKDIGRDYVGNS